MVGELNQLLADLGKPPMTFGAETGVFEPGASQKQITGTTNTMTERRALVKAAGMKIHGSPSEADAVKARKILDGSGGQKPASGALTQRQQNFAIVRLAGIKFRGSPTAATIIRARKSLARRGIALPSELTAAPLKKVHAARPPMNEDMKQKLRLRTAYRWRIVREAGLQHLCQAGRLPSNELLDKAERKLKRMKKANSVSERLRAGLAGSLKEEANSQGS